MDYRIRTFPIAHAAVALLFTTVVGCGTSANITLQDELEVSGTILSSDDEHVYIETDNGKRSVSRDIIEDIDHPGNGAGITGVIVLAYGIANIAVGVSNCNHQGAAAACMGVLTPAAVGIGLMGWGFTVWGRSIRAARAKNDRGDYSHLRISPTYVWNGATGGPGLVLAQTF